MQNDLCLRTGDLIRIGKAPEWMELTIDDDGRMTSAIVGIPSSAFPISNMDLIREVKYKFTNGDYARRVDNGREFLVDDANDLNKHKPGVFVRVSYPPPITLHTADLGTITAPVTIPDDIFHVEKRLKGGKRVFNDLTVTVAPIPDHAAVKLSFTQPVTPVYNAATLREIASLLNEIADCL